MGFETPDQVRIGDIRCDVQRPGQDAGGQWRADRTMHREEEGKVDEREGKGGKVEGRMHEVGERVHEDGHKKNMMSLCANGRASRFGFWVYDLGFRDSREGT